MNVKEFSATFGDGNDRVLVQYMPPSNVPGASEDTIQLSPGRLTFEQAEELARVLMHLTGGSW